MLPKPSLCGILLWAEQSKTVTQLSRGLNQTHFIDIVESRTGFTTKCISCLLLILVLRLDASAHTIRDFT